MRRPIPRRRFAFAQSTYEAGARLQGWPLEQLELRDERRPSRDRAPQELSELAACTAPNPGGD